MIFFNILLLSLLYFHLCCTLEVFFEVLYQVVLFLCDNFSITGEIYCIRGDASDFLIQLFS